MDDVNDAFSESETNTEQSECESRLSDTPDAIMSDHGEVGSTYNNETSPIYHLHNYTHAVSGLDHENEEGENTKAVSTNTGEEVTKKHYTSRRNNVASYV